MGPLICGIAVVSAGDAVDWSPTINTFLLLLLAIVAAVREYYSRRDAKEIQERAKQLTALTADVHQSITGEHRDTELRTRTDDKLL